MFPESGGPLSDDEFHELCDCLDAYSDFDYGAFMGVLHAIALAPGVIPPSVWLQEVLPEGMGALDQEQGTAALGLIMRQYNEVMTAVADGQFIIPDPNEAASCKSFAMGYTLGACLDGEWMGHDERWVFVAPFAFLAGEHDLIPADVLERMEADPDGEQNIRNDFTGLLASTNDNFQSLRRSLAEQSGATSPGAAAKVGRNDACPCGSGKKYKRCCGAPAAGAPN